jgi:hypothetical protein
MSNFGGEEGFVFVNDILNALEFLNSFTFNSNSVEKWKEVITSLYGVEEHHENICVLFDKITF